MAQFIQKIVAPNGEKKLPVGSTGIKLVETNNIAES